ncbi:thiamine pyrophosphate-dependent dehydrogenase E1 component subunit alpha [Candidatus Omnitrophota bacterium]
MRNKSYSIKFLKEAYYLLSKIRKVEEKIADLYPQQQMKCPVHLHTGEEAIAAGVCKDLVRGDYVFSTHRNHSHFIAKGGDIKRLIAELYGRQTGCGKGKGGSMHTMSKDINFYTSAIVGGTLPLATGAAYAQVLKKTKNVVIAFFGDGAVDTGTFYESLNFAFLKKLPIVFVCENNFYATHSHFLSRQPKDNIYQRTYPFGMPGVIVDGNDILEVYEKAKSAIARARNKLGPTLLECRTYRWLGHVGPSCDHNLGYRKKRELDLWMKRCPVNRFRGYLLKKKALSTRQIEVIDKRIDMEVGSAFSFAKRSSYPKTEELYKDI